MTTRPEPCRLDRSLGERVTRRHRNDCGVNTCEGCKPCTAPHCVVCGREHLNNDHPMTCPKCVGVVRDDLTDIQTANQLLRREAQAAGRDGRLAAAAAIPGGTAQVLIGPTVRLDLMKITRTTAETHRPSDPIPPVAILAQWEDIYRTWLDHTPADTWATVTSCCRYLADQLTYIANTTDPTAPDWLAFTRQIRDIRARLERALHDEREPEHGVECFECGTRLVRRFRPPVRCRHQTPARLELAHQLRTRAAALDWLQVLATYPEAGAPTPTERSATGEPARLLIAAARMPCENCLDQGGITDPTAGRSWECPGCRKTYNPGEYATAVRRDLLDNGADGDGWTHITMAADAATELTGRHIPANTVRRWMDRNQVASCCLWTSGRPAGPRLVYWPDVADRALRSTTRDRSNAS